MCLKQNKSKQKEQNKNAFLLSNLYLNTLSSNVKIPCTNIQRAIVL